MRKHHDYSEITNMKPTFGPQEESSRFSIAALLLSVVVLSVLFYQLAIQVPQDIGGREPGEGFGETLVAGIEGAALTLGSHPVAAFGAFVALLAPGLIFYRQSRHYFHTLILCALIFSGASFVLTKQPAKRLGNAIHQMSTERELTNY
ncbi:MAG: hypothetical protein MK538_20255 [Planctomycetes bacterium]|nr:hypothetical protein [Planctomycetota bacterium]